MNRRLAQTAGLCIAAVLFLLFFGWLCPFQIVTGLPCPGCNMTTAVYWLLQGNLSRSFWYHPMAVPTIAAACLWLCFRSRPKLQNTVLLIWAVSMIVCYIWRMAAVFPHPPMQPEGGLFSLIAEWSQ
ncbi:DUF2752 domain-containing protein [Faecalibaculum rodentium]|uniref:DUF2752 domain-containing protein n=1 Tax=Faecalibaculum rodentium TaxID=1702221 RepID=UPI0023F3EB6C|nr:DUF2752 domain-containing protein [Faecalibaculum rodentium]